MSEEDLNLTIHFSQNDPDEPARLTPFLKVLCVAFYSLLGVLAVYGNVLVVLVICRFRRMRTATNILIFNMAIADLLIGLFCVPFSYWQVLIFDNQRWVFGSAMCSLLSFFQGTAVFLSSWTLVAISFDRWLAIMFVMKPGLRLTRRRALLWVSATWFFSILMALPLFAVSRVVVDSEGIERCDEDWSTFNDANTARRLYSYVILALQFAVPQFVVIITYTFIGIKMWNSGVPGDAAGSLNIAAQVRHDAVKKLIPMVIRMSAFFAVSWLPLLLLINVIIDVWPQIGTWKYILFLWWFCHALAMLHSVVNPIVYYMRNERFREGISYFLRYMPLIHFTGIKLLNDKNRQSTVRQRRDELTSTSRQIFQKDRPVEYSVLVTVPANEKTKPGNSLETLLQ